MAKKTLTKPVPTGYEIGDMSSFEVVPKRPKTMAELSKRSSALDVARWGGGVLESYGGDSSRLEVDFDPRRPGFIWLKVKDKRVLVHKDELMYFVRFAKGGAV